MDVIARSAYPETDVGSKKLRFMHSCGTHKFRDVLLRVLQILRHGLLVGAVLGLPFSTSDSLVVACSFASRAPKSSRFRSGSRARSAFNLSKSEKPAPMA